MAALSSTLPSVSLAFHTHVVSRRRCRNNPVTTTSALQQRCLTGLTTNSSAMNSAFQNRGVTRISAVDPGSVGLDLSGVNLPIPPWAQWLVGAFVFAVPVYRQFRAMEDKVERTAEAAIEVIDKVVEETEKIAGEVADAFPGNEMIKEAAAKIKAVADEIEEDADKAEALIEKVDEIKKDIDSIIDPIIDKVSKE